MLLSLEDDPTLLAIGKDEITEEKSLRLEGLVNDVLNSDSPILPDLEYDDKACPRYKNFIDACLDPKGLNFALFSRQGLIGIHLLGEWCPKCTPKKYHHIQGVPVDAPLREVPRMVTLLDKGRCPKCKRSKRHLIKHKYLKPYSTLSACIGQRAGKSLLGWYIVAYVTMQFLMLQDPLKALGLGAGTPLTGTCTAQTFSNALRLVWIPLRSIMTKSPWFKQYNEIMKDYDYRYGNNLIKIHEEQILYGHRSILLYPSSPNMHTLRGDTRMWSLAEEISHWGLEITTTNKVREMSNAKGVITSMDNSLLTARTAVEKAWSKGYLYNIPLPPMIAVSSPLDSRDRMMMMLREAKTSNTNLGVHLPTWEVNPAYSRDSTFIKEKYRTNPIDAERDFGANPPKNSMPYVESLKDSLPAFNATRPNSVANALREVEGQSQYKEVKILANEILKGVPSAQEYPALLALDAGIVKDSFAGVIMAKSPNLQVDYDVLGVIEIIPDYKNGRTLNFTNISESVLTPIIDHFNVNTIVTDNWQHFKLLHDLEAQYNKGGAKKLETLSYALKTQDMSAFRSVLSRSGKGSGNISLPALEVLKHQETHGNLPNLNPEDLVNGIYAPHIEDLDVLDSYPEYFEGNPVLHLAYQCVYVRWDGKKILKSEGATDDLLRTLVLAHTVISDEKLTSRLTAPLVGKGATQSGGFLGISGSKIRGGGNGTAGGSRVGAKGGY